MGIDIAIKRQKNKLVKIAKENGLYENFGQKEVRALEEKYIDISVYTQDMNIMRSSIQAFDEWCMNYTDQKI